MSLSFSHTHTDHFQSNFSYFMLAHNVMRGFWWYDSIGWTFPSTNHKYFALLQIAAEYQVGKTTSDMKVFRNQRFMIEFFPVEKHSPTDMHGHWVNTYREQTEL